MTSEYEAFARYTRAKKNNLNFEHCGNNLLALITDTARSLNVHKEAVLAIGLSVICFAMCYSSVEFSKTYKARCIIWSVLCMGVSSGKSQVTGFFQDVQEEMKNIYSDILNRELEDAGSEKDEHFAFKVLLGTCTTEKRLTLLSRCLGRFFLKKEGSLNLFLKLFPGVLHCLEDELQLHKTFNKYNAGSILLLLVVSKRIASE